MAAAPGGGGNDDGVPNNRLVSRAELVKQWEDLFDKEDNDKAMELFVTGLLRHARAEYAQQARKEEEEEEDDDDDGEEEQRGACIFEPWQPPPPGSAPPPPPPVAPRVERTVVMGLRAPPHLLPRKHEGTPAAKKGKPAKKNRAV